MRRSFNLSLCVFLAFSPVAQGEENCRIHFHPATGESERIMAAEAINSHYKDEQYPLSYWLEEANYEIAYIDLNGDKKKEIIIRVEAGDWCGSAGCNSFIFQEIKNKLIKIGHIKEGAILWNMRSNGYHNLSSCDGQSEIIHTFDGHRYSYDTYFSDEDMKYHPEGLTWLPPHPPRPDGRSWCERGDGGAADSKFCDE